MNQKQGCGCSGCAVPIVVSFGVLLLISFVVNAYEWMVAHPWLSAGILILALLVSLAVSAESRKARERRRQRAAEQADKGLPIIHRFLNTYIPPEKPWPPPKVYIPEADVMALRTILTEAGVAPDEMFVVNEGAAFRRLDGTLIDELAEREITKRFGEKFLAGADQLRESRDLQRWAARYVDLFQDDPRYIPVLVNLLIDLRRFIPPAEGSARTAYVEQLVQKVSQHIQDEAQQRIHRRRVEQLKEAMHFGQPVVRRTMESLDEMDGIEFEHLLQQLFEAMGYQAEVTKGSGDQGADLILTKMGEKTVVQAKRYSGKVSNKAVQEVVAAKQFYGCERAIVVTTATFTESARQLAEANDVELWDRESLKKLLATYL